MDYYEITKKLIGHIHPVGQTHIDADRYTNLVNMCDLAEQIISSIRDVAQFKDNPQYSVNVAGEYAYNFLQRLSNND